MEPQVDFTPLLIVTILAVAVPILLHRIPGVHIVDVSLENPTLDGTLLRDVAFHLLGA